MNKTLTTQHVKLLLQLMTPICKTLVRVGRVLGTAKRLASYWVEMILTVAAPFV